MKPNIERLTKLLRHMESGKLSVDKFNFNYFWHKTTCGTSGCMAGECPSLWPEEWDWDYRDPVLRTQRTTMGSLMEFFDLSNREVKQLFYPEDWGNSESPLEPTATREQVTENLRQFIQSQTNHEANEEPVK